MQLSPQLKKYKAFKTFKLSQYYKSNSTCLYIKLLAASSNCHWLGNALRLCLCCCPSPPAKVVQDHCHKNWPLWVFHWWDVSFPEACLRLSGSSFRELSELAHCQVTGCGLIAMEEWLVRLEVTESESLRVLLQTGSYKEDSPLKREAIVSTKTLISRAMSKYVSCLTVLSRSDY